MSPKSILLLLLTIAVPSSFHLVDAYAASSRDEIDDHPEQVPQWHQQHQKIIRHTVKHHENQDDRAEEAPHDQAKLRVIKRRHLHRSQPQPTTEDEIIQEIFTPNQQALEGRKSSISKRQTGYQSPTPNFYQTNSVPGSNINNHIHQYSSGQNNNAYPYLPFGFPFSVGFLPVYIQIPCSQPQRPQILPQQPNQPQMPSGVPNRFGEDGDQPSWGVVDDDNNIGGSAAPIPPSMIDFDKDYFNTPTGISLEPVAPLRPNARPPPPILHGSNARPEDQSSNNFQTQRPQTQRPQTQRPQPQRPQVQTQAPQQQQPNIPPPAPIPTTSNQSGRDSTNPLNCAYAIVSCCNNVTDDIRTRARCFTMRGCPGPFFDNPCGTDFAKAANSFINRFYNGQ